jgi:lipopolysaccharide transport system ATP-binding protein
VAIIELEGVSVDFPIYSASGRSLKSRLINVATGGSISNDENGVVVVRALENLNFKIGHGERVALLGHNGAGKSTLLRVLCGVYTPNIGAVYVQGNINSLIDISLGIDPEASGLENIYIRGRLLGLSSSEIKDKINEIVQYSELGDFINIPVRTYSSGMHMRLAFSISTTLRSEIVIMDEWLSVGDESFKVKTEQRMRELIDSSSILILATHSKELVLNTCSRAIWLEHGKVLMDDKPHVVCEKYF